MSRAILAIGAVVVIGVGIALWIVVRSDPSPATSSAATHVVTEKPETTPAPAPALSEGSPKTPRMRNDGDVITHDHRTQARRSVDAEAPPPKQDPPAPAPDVPSRLTFDVTRGVKKAVEECGSFVPASERTGPARMRGTITVNVKSGVATIQGADLAVTGATGTAADQARQCVAQKSMGLQTAAADQADLESYAIEVSFLIP